MPLASRALLQDRAGGGAAIADEHGALRGVWMCRRHHPARFPRTFAVRPARVADALAVVGATPASAPAAS